MRLCEVLEPRRVPNREFLYETPSQHLTHIEDLVLHGGINGVKGVVSYIQEITKMLSGHAPKGKVTTKWDGAPAVVAGIDPEDGKFFVGTKSAFAKAVPKKIKNIKDLDKFYSEQPGLKNVLGLAFKHLRQLDIPGVLFGDIMFTSSILYHETVEGEDLLMFKPNTIAYGVPAGSDLAKEISKAKIGVVWHTQYVGGPTLRDMQPEFGVVAPKSTKDVWSHDATYKDLSGIVTLSDKETTIINKSVDKIHHIISKVNTQKFNSVLDVKGFAKDIEDFINARIKQGAGQVHNTNEFLKDFIKHYEDKLLVGIEDLSGGAEGLAAKRRLQKVEDKKNLIIEHNQVVLAMLAIYKIINNVKSLLIEKLSRIEGMKIFYPSNGGYDVGTPEGFVAIDHIGNAVKLVDRIEFTARNFATGAPRN
jgi:hypothetical protein